MKNKQQIFKFKVHTTEYPSLLAIDLNGIQKMLGDFVVVKVRPGVIKNTIWVKRKEIEGNK